MRRNNPSGGGGSSIISSNQDKSSSNGNGVVVVTNGGATSTTTTTTIRSRRRRKQQNGWFMFSPFQEHFMTARSEKEKTTFLLIIVMCVLACGLLYILYQICWVSLSVWSSISSRIHFPGSHGFYQRGGGGGGAHNRGGAWPLGGGGGGGGHDKKGHAASLPNMPFNPIYRIPEAHDKVGDRSDSYARLRQQVDAQLPVNDERSLLAVHQLKLVDNPHHHGNKKDNNDNKVLSHVMDPSSFFYQNHQDGDLVEEPYDVYNCPDTPPKGYPFQWNLVHEILHDWPVNDYASGIPDQIYNGLCIFDYSKDHDKALRYRRAEQPFVVENDPQVARTIERWAMVPNYMEQMLGKKVLHRAEYNTNNHFLYSMPKRPPPRKRNVGTRQQQQPLELQDLHGRPAKLQNQAASPNAIRMTYRDWLTKANASSSASSSGGTNTDGVGLLAGPNDEHWYFRLIGCGYMGPDGSCDQGSSEYLFDELPFLQPHNDTLYMGNGQEQMGIHCRFGMQGVLAEVSVESCVVCCRFFFRCACGV